MLLCEFSSVLFLARLWLVREWRGERERGSEREGGREGEREKAGGRTGRTTMMSRYLVMF